MKQSEIREAIRKEFPRIDKYALNAVCLRVERKLAEGAMLTASLVKNVSGAYIRHSKTAYDTMMNGQYYGGTRQYARLAIAPIVTHTINTWR